MRWNLTNTLNDSHFWTLHENETKAGLRYNQEAQSIRLDAEDKRLFFLEKKGVLQTKILLKTEYSVVVGECQFDKSRSGILLLEDTKFSFSFRDNRLILSDRHKQTLAEVIIDGVEKLGEFEFAALLFASGRMRIKRGIKAAELVV